MCGLGNTSPSSIRCVGGVGSVVGDNCPFLVDVMVTESYDDCWGCEGRLFKGALRIGRHAGSWGAKT